jgi:hypothetical protein
MWYLRGNERTELTDRTDNAIRLKMRSSNNIGLYLGMVMGLAGVLIGGLSGCVQISAPDKPIVINLNINIKQEVVYRLDGDAKDLINEEADIF